MSSSPLMGAKPMTTFGTKVSGNAHVADGMNFTQHTQPSLLTGGVGHFQNMETRNPTNGVPHISMKPGKM